MSKFTILIDTHTKASTTIMNPLAEGLKDCAGHNPDIEINSSNRLCNECLEYGQVAFKGEEKSADIHVPLLRAHWGV